MFRYCQYCRHDTEFTWSQERQGWACVCGYFVPKTGIKAILSNPAFRREMMITLIIATQAREGIETTRAQAERAYDAVQREKAR